VVGTFNAVCVRPDYAAHRRSSLRPGSYLFLLGWPLLLSYVTGKLAEDFSQNYDGRAACFAFSCRILTRLTGEWS